MTAASYQLGGTCIGYQHSSSDGSLSPRTFSEGSNSWTVSHVCQPSGGDFTIDFASGSTAVGDLVDSNLKFHFGSTTFSNLTDGANTAGTQSFLITSSGLTPVAGTTYTLKFTRNQAPTAPKNLRAKGVSPSQIELSWDAPEKTGGTDVTGYKIEVSTDGTSGWTELVAGQEARAFTHMGVTANTMLYYRVSAINAAGTGSPSGVALANTAAPPPSSFMSRENADGSLILWEAEMTAASYQLGGTCIGYQHSLSDGSLSPRTFSHGSNSWTVSHVCQPSGGDFTIGFASGSTDVGDLVDSNLKFHFDSTTFSNLTDSANTAGMTSFLITSSGLTPTADTTYTLKFTRDQVPSAPRNLRAKGVSATKINLHWGAPEKTGGTAVTGYKIEVTADPDTAWSELVMSQTATTFSHTVHSGATRYYRVSAINAAGTSVASNVASATAEDTAPQLRSVNFDKHASRKLVVLDYNEKLNSAITPDKSAFTVKIEGTVRTLDRIVVAGFIVQLWLDDPFRPGETGTVSYTKPATNPLQDAAGNESASFTNVPGVNLLEPIAPDAPTNLHAKGVSTTQIDLSWSAPEYTGGADIMGYTIEVSADRGLTWSEVVASQTATTFSHTVASSTLRYYRVSAFNAAGNGVWSRTASAGAMDTAPGVVSAEIGNPDDTVVTLFFDEAPVSNSTPAASAFAVTFGGKARTPRTATIRTSPDRVRLVLAAADAVKPGERVTVSYTKPFTTPLKDATGNETASFTDYRVGNELPTDFPELLVHDEEVHESGDGTDATMTFTVSVDKEPDFPVGVHYETEDVTATGGDPTDKGSLKSNKRSKDPEDIECDDFRSLPDYISTSGRLTFGPGETSHEVEVTVCDDGTEDSSETFRLVLRSTQLHEPISALGEIGPNGKGYGDEVTASETGTILNEETTTEVSIVADGTYAEEGTEAVFTLRRAGDADEALTVPVSVVEDGAVLGTPVPASVTFAAGSRQAALGVTTDDDGANEADSTVTATLEAGFAWQVAEGAASAAVTVLDNDAAPVTSGSTADVTVWSADMTVVEYGPRSIGAGSAALFSNQAGRAGLRATRLWYDPSERKLRLGFDDGLDDAESLTLHLGGVSVGFPENSGGDSSFTLEEVDLSWTDGETVAVRVSKPSAVAVSTDATLVSLAVEGASLSPAFDAGVAVYRAEVDAGVETVTVAASATDGGASVAYGPAADGDAELADHQVAVAEGETLVEVTVTAADGKTVRSYRVVAVRAAANKAPAGLPAITGTAKVGEELTASAGDIADADGVAYATFAWQWLADDGTQETEIEGATGERWTPTVAELGRAVRVRATFTDDKGTEETLTSEASEAVAATVASAPVGVAVATPAGRERELAVSWGAPESDGGSEVTGYRVQWKTGAEAYDGSEGSTRQAVLSDAGAASHTIAGLANGTAYTVRVQAANAQGAGAAAEVEATVEDGVAPALTGAVVDGAVLTLTYGEALDEASAPAADAYTVTVAGTARTVDAVVVSQSAVTLTLASAVAAEETVTVGYAVPGDGDAARIEDAAGNAAAGFTGEAVANETGAANTAPTGLPAITGTPEVGEELTASVDAVADADGLENATFAYQWLANDGTQDTDIEGATGATYRLTAAEAGQTLKVRVTYTDDKGTEETLTSAPTETVVDRRPVAATLSVGAGAAEAGRFRLRITFADAMTGLAVSDLAAARVGGDAAAVSDLTEAETGRAWTAWVAAADAGRYTVRLAGGAAQAGERRSLAAVLAVDVDAQGNATAVSGPVVTAVALATASDGTWTDGETVRVTLTFSEPVTVVTDGGTPSVGVVLDGTAREAAYAGGTGRLVVFSYTVAADDGTVSAVTVTADSLALNGGTIRDAGGRDADLAHPGLGEAATDEAQTESVVALTGLTLVDTGTGTETALADGDALVLDDPANGSYGLAATVASDAGVSSVLLELTGAKTVTVTDDAAPYSLYGDEDGTVTGAGLPAGSYTLSATAYPEAGGGAALGTLAVSFTVAAGEAVDPDGLTASFEGVPAEHDGSSPFTFRVRFNLEPRVSYKVLRDESFAVTGGEVDKARRVDGRNDLREIHIEPEGWDDVAVMLAGGRACGTEGAICTADNKVLANTATATVPGPLALSVADVQVQEGPNAMLAFQVTLNRASSGTVTVDYASADGTATSGADYTAVSGMLTFDAGETAKTVNVTVLDDAHDDGQETLELTLSNATGARLRDGEATGTIENSDPLQQAWVARFGRTVASEVVSGITDRLASPRSSSHVRIGGISLEQNGSTWTETPVDDDTEIDDTEIGNTLEDARTMTGKELLMRSAFRLQSESDGPGGASWTAWGRFSSSSFEGEADGVELSADVATGLLGADVGTDEWTAGIALSAAKGDGPFRLTSDKASTRNTGTADSTLTSVHPYAQVSVADRVALWAIGGYGAGDMTIAANGGPPMKTDIDMTMVAVGVRGPVLDAGAGDALDLAVRTDALWLRATSDRSDDMLGAKADVTRLRLMLDTSRDFTLAGGTLTPSLEAGVRRDAGDAEEGAGFELGAGLSYQGAGISIEGKVRTLVAHNDDAYEEWGASASVRIDPGSDGRGMSLAVAPTWGSAASAAEQLWGAGDATRLVGSEAFEAKTHLDTEIGYGLGAPQGWGVVTPYAGVTLSDGAQRTLRGGLRWNASQSATMALEAERQDEGEDASPTNAVMLRARVRF